MPSAPAGTGGHSLGNWDTGSNRGVVFRGAPPKLLCGWSAVGTGEGGRKSLRVAAERG